MSDTNQVRLNFVPETTPGTTPTNPVFRRLRFTGAPDLAYAPQTIVSNEIVPGRQVQDTTPVGAEAGGTAEFEFSYYDHDELIAGALYSTWAQQNYRGAAESVVVVSNEFNFDTGTAFAERDIVFGHGFTNDANNGVHVAEALSSATKIVVTGLVAEASPPAEATVRLIGRRGTSGEFALTVTGFANLTSSGFDFTTVDLEVGDWVYVSAFSTTAANGWYRISAIAAGQLTFDAAGHTPAADAGTGDTVDVFFGDRLRNGSTEKSFTLEQRFTDHSPETIQYFTGMHVDELTLTMEPQAIMTGKYTFRGFDADLDDAGRVSGATDLSPLLSVPVNTSSDIGLIRQGGAAVEGPNFILELEITIKNNLRFIPAVAVFGAAGVGAGEFGVSGKIGTYFGNKTLAQNVVNGTETSLDFRVEDQDGATVLFDIPRLKFTAGAPEVPGKNEDVVLNLEFQALARLVTDSYTININRFWRTSAA